MSEPPNDIAQVVRISADVSRRDFFITASAAAGGLALAQGPARAAIVRADFAGLPPYGNATLPAGIRSRMVDNVNGMTVHMLEAGFEVADRPCVLLLLHGFPELAYSWRKAFRSWPTAGAR
jgi:hypothetical protein